MRIRLHDKGYAGGLEVEEVVKRDASSAFVSCFLWEFSPESSSLY